MTESVLPDLPPTRELPAAQSAPTDINMSEDTAVKFIPPDIPLSRTLTVGTDTAEKPVHWLSAR